MDKLSVPGPTSQLRRFPLRWLGMYLLLWFIPSPLGELPWIGPPLLGAIGAAKEQGASWLSRLVLGGAGVSAPYSGGSDRTIDYYSCALLLIVSCVLAAIIRLSAQRDRQLFAALHGYLRLILACTMMLYGLCKVFPLQFHVPGPRVLTMTLGDLEPWEVMWLFMGVSLPYTVFAGIAEIIGGALLMWKRTTMFGALILLVVMGNVALMDLCYNVDMKVFAWHLVLAIIVVLAPETPRLMRALLAKDPEAPASARWLLVARHAVFLLFTGQTLHWCWTMMQDDPGRHPLHGIWTVEAPSQCTWHTVAIQRGSVTTISRDQTRKLYKIDAQVQSADGLTLMDAETAMPVGTLSATATRETLLLAGDFAGEPLQLALRRSAEPALSANRFQWVHDEPPKPR